jgi:hypothetical protein
LPVNLLGRFFLAGMGQYLTIGWSASRGSHLTLDGVELDADSSMGHPLVGRDESRVVWQPVFEPRRDLALVPQVSRLDDALVVEADPYLPAAEPDTDTRAERLGGRLVTDEVVVPSDADAARSLLGIVGQREQVEPVITPEAELPRA